MSDTDARKTERDCVPKQQVKIALHLMEEFHGDSLRRPWSDEAHAYYHAVKAIEDALDEKFDPNATYHLMDVRRSRRAMESGYEDATLLNERFGKDEDEPNGGLVHQILEIFR